MTTDVRALAILFLAACAAACDGTADEAPEPPPAAPVALPATTPHQAGVELPGGIVTADVDEGCGTCHEQIVAAYARSGMHEAMTLPAGAGSPEAGFVGREFVHDGSGIRLRFGAADGRYEQTISYVDPAGVERVRFTLPVHLVVGSGAATRSYYSVAPDGSLLMLPVTWFRELGDVSLSPGAGFRSVATRAATTLCVQCHTGDAEPRDANVRFGFRGKLTLGVGCSRCHGDGAEHALTGDPRSIVNPSRLPVERQSDVCYQCHLAAGTQVFVPGRSLRDFRPGEPLSTVSAMFVPETGKADAGAAIAGHAERLEKSACFRESEGMTCTTCHNPHAPAGLEAANACGVCHDDGACGEAHATRAGHSCASCHMAQVPSSDIAHTRTTDHWVRRRPEPPPAAGLSPEATSIAAHAVRDLPLVDLLDPEGASPHAELLLAQAYLIGADAAAATFGVPAPGYVERAGAILDRLLAARPTDVDVAWRAARALRLRGRAQQAADVLDAALVLHGSNASVVAERGLTALALDDVPGAARWLARACDTAPDDLELVHGLALALERAGRPDDALAVLQKTRARCGPRLDLAEIGDGIAERAGRTDVALEFAWDRLVFLPREPLALVRAGEHLYLLGRGAESRPLLGEALRLAPDCIPALYGMAQLAGEAGDADAAADYAARARAAEQRGR